MSRTTLELHRKPRCLATFLTGSVLVAGCAWFQVEPDRAETGPAPPPEYEATGSVADLWAGQANPIERYLWIMRADRTIQGDRTLLEFDVVVLDSDGHPIPVELQERCDAGDDQCAEFAPQVLLASGATAACEVHWSSQRRNVRAQELSVMIVADASGSMQPYQGKLVSTLDAVSRASRDRGGRTSIALFDQLWATACSFTDPSCGTSDVERLLALGDWWGATALWDASIYGLQQLRTEDPQRERILVVITDGEDTSSVDTMEDFVSRARQAEIKPFFIEISSSSANDELRAAALGARGEYLDGPAVDNLRELYATLDRSVLSHLRVTAELRDCPDVAAIHATADLPASGGAPSQRVSATRPFVEVGPPTICSPDHGIPLAVQFGLDMHTVEIDPRLENWFAAVVDRLDRFPGWRLDLHGEADGLGKFDRNRRLSRRRAEFVESELVARGADASRVRVVPHGEGKIDTNEERPELRRVSFSWRPLANAELPPGCAE